MNAMAMDIEERDRLVRLEVEMENIAADVKEIKQAVKNLSDTAMMGKGALLMAIRTGAIVTAIISGFAWLAAKVWGH